MNIVNIEEKEIRLNSGMSEAAFGKTNYNSIVTEAGVLATCDSYENNSWHFTFSEWTFDEIKSFDIPERTVFYCAKNPLSEKAKTFSDYFDDEKISDEAFEAGFLICSILTQAAKEGAKIPLNGAGGILIDMDGEKTKVLFLPGNLYKYSVGGVNQSDFTKLQGGWVNPTLYDLPSLCFERASIAYRILSARFAYPAENTIERNADILDRKFLPVELCVNGIVPQLAAAINKGLKLNSNAVEIPGKKKKGKNSEDLTPTPDFPLDLLYAEKNAVHETKLTDEELNEKAAAYNKFQTKKVNAKRNIRRNWTTIIICSIVTVIVGALVFSAIQSDLDDYNSKGLTSTETVEVFYKGMNDKDTILMENVSKGKEIKASLSGITNIYVISKQRQASYHDHGFVPPEEYFYYAKNFAEDKACSIYGISNVMIDGVPTELEPKMFKKREKAAPLTVENGKTLNDRDTVNHKVSYYFIYSEGEDNEILVEYIEDDLTLTYMKNRWIITKKESKNTKIPMNSSLFKMEYYQALEQNENTVNTAALSLKEKYPWIPTEHALQKVLDRLVEMARNPLAGI